MENKKNPFYWDLSAQAHFWHQQTLYRILHNLPCFGFCGVLLQHTLYCYKQIKLTTWRLTSPVCQIENKSIYLYPSQPVCASAYLSMLHTIYAKYMGIPSNFFFAALQLVYVDVGCQTANSTWLILTQFTFLLFFVFDEKCGHKTCNRWDIPLSIDQVQWSVFAVHENAVWSFMFLFLLSCLGSEKYSNAIKLK